MLAIRLLYTPRLPRIISVASQIRDNSKITHKDSKRNSGKVKHSFEDKAFINMAKEGRKLFSVLDDFNPGEHLEKEYSKQNSEEEDIDIQIDNLITNSRQYIDKKAPREHLDKKSENFNKKGLEEDFGKMVPRNNKVSKYPFLKSSPMENLEKLRKGEKPEVLSLLKRDAMPLFSQKNSSELFVKPTSSTVLATERNTPFERELQESQKFLNSLIYSNPFKAKKEDPYDLSYPVNNEDGQPAEKGVSFKDHVILDHLYEGFPKTGEIRNFIELVITGLSQNAYLTPEEKREHVDWFKREFETLSADDIKRMSNYVAPKFVRKRRLKKKV